MNDWLDYIGSGSYRSTIEHAAYHPNTKPIAQQAANSVRGREYDILNAELDALYSEMQTQLARQKKAAADMNSFINAAHRLKATLVASANGNRWMNNKWASLNSKIDSFSGSSLQKTALRNKMDSMTNKFNSAVPKTEHLATDINFDTFNTLIDELNQNSKTSRR